MQQTPPPPPPPVPPPPPQQQQQEKQHGRHVSSVDVDISSTGALPFRACDRGAGIWLLGDLRVEPELQVGPTCGLVALCMAATSICGRGASRARAPSVQDLLEDAVSRGFTRQGEMFSAADLAALAHSCGLHATIVQEACVQDVCKIVASGRSLSVAPRTADTMPHAQG